VTVERFPVEAGHVMMFARAIGDTNPVYVDASRSEGGAIPAPPTFVTASAQYDPDYPLRPKPGKPWFGSGREATGAPPSGGGGSRSNVAAGLHAEQHYEYHRPLRVGDVLRARTRKGREWTKQGRSGTLRFSEIITEYLDEHGALDITARAVGVLTEGPR
jgi:acyl dehydratase